MSTRSEQADTQLRQLRMDIKFARTHGTMSVLRELQARVFKFLRTRDLTKHVSLDDLRLLRTFLRDPFTAPKNVRPKTGPAGKPETDDRQDDAVQHQISESPYRIEATNAFDDTATKTPGIRYYKHPSDTEDRSSQKLGPRPSPPKMPKRNADTPRQPGQPIQYRRTPDESNPSPAIFANQRRSDLAGRPRRLAQNLVAQTDDQTGPYDPNARGRYSTFIQFDSSQGNTVRTNVNEWLEQKGLEPKFGATHTQRIEHTRTVVSSVDTTDIGTRYSEVRIVEDTSGMFTTTITMGISALECWVYIEVESANNYYPAIPRVARRLLGAGRVDEASTGWHCRPQKIDIDYIEELYSYLLSPKRQLPVFLVATLDDSEQIEEYLENAKTWSRFLSGAALFATLTPSATAELVARLPHNFAPSPWAIRTYQPQLDAEDPADSPRHRFIGQYRISSEEQQRTRNRLGRIANEARALATRPAQLHRAQRAIERTKNRILLRGDEERLSSLRIRSTAIKEGATVEGVSQDGLATHEELGNLTVLRELIGVESVSEDLILELASLYESRPDTQVLDRLDSISEEVTQYREESDHLRSINDYYLDDAQKLEEELELAQSRLKFVQRELSEAGQNEVAYSFRSEIDTFEGITSFADLESIMENLGETGLFFTGDIDTMLEIDEIDSKGQALKRLIRCLRCLIEYREDTLNKRNSVGLYNYLQNPTGAYAVPASYFAPRESESSMNKYGDQRRFNVPPEVDPSGEVQMEAHFRLARIGMRSPRMYILDDLHRTEAIYIGYIGDHLTTAGTN